MKNRPGSPGVISKKFSAPLTSEVELQLFERWLQLPAESTGVITEHELVSSSKSQGGFLLEQSFDTSDAAVFSSEYFSQADQDALKPIAWRHVAGLCVAPNLHYCRLVQGVLCRSSWFLGALAAVATNQSLLLNIIVSDEHASRGLYTFQFYKHGAWRQVVVDNRLPCLELQQRLAFASSSTPQELWPSLIEKAYARLHGGYSAIAAGCVADALTDLTGGVVDTVSLSAGLLSEGAVWLAIMQHLAAGNIAVCTPHVVAAATGGTGGCAGRVDGCIMPNSPYSIIAATVLPSGLQLVRLHNPWSPEGCWQGAWGRDAPEWSTDEGQAALAADPAMAEGLQDPATFWCSFWDFMQVFSTLYLLHLPGSDWQQATVTSGWPGTILGDVECTPPQQQHAALVQQAAPNSLQPGLLMHSASQQQQQWQRQQQELPVHPRQQCQEVSAGSVVWACRPQIKLSVSATCQVMVSLGQRDTKVQAQISQDGAFSHHHQQQQQHSEGLHIGLRVCHARPSSPALPAKALAAAGLSRPSTSIMCNRVCPGSRGSSRSRSKSPTLRRPSTAPVSAADAAAARPDDDDAAAASSMYRVWVPERCPAVGDSGISSSRDVVLKFVAEQGRCYIVMPYTRSPRDTGPFVLRAVAPHALQLEELPSVYGLMQGGQWLGSSAGGSRAQPTWASNPQFLLTCPREATALVCLQRPDVCNSLLQQPFEPSGRISLTVCQPDAAPGGKVGTPQAVTAAATAAAAAAAVAGSKVVGSTGYSSMERTALLMRLQPDTPYVLVPSTAEPGVEVPFELCVLSSHPLELIELPVQCTIRHTGSWGTDTAGGSNLHSSWLHNLAFTLQLERRTLCRWITLTRAGGSWRRNQPLGEMLGLSVLRQPHASSSASGSQQQQQPGSPQRQSRSPSPQQHKQPSNSLTMLKQHQLHEAAFVPMQAVEFESELPGGVPLLLVPCTYAPGVQGAFTLSVTTSGCTFSCEPVPGGLAALLAATGARVTRPKQH